MADDGTGVGVVPHDEMLGPHRQASRSIDTAIEPSR